jgi:hypothetical protein
LVQLLKLIAGTISTSALIECGKSARRRWPAVKERKLNYRFHDPNPAAVTADYILKIFIEANAGKVEAAIQKAADEGPDRCQGHSA